MVKLAMPRPAGDRAVGPAGACDDSGPLTGPFVASRSRTAPSNGARFDNGRAVADDQRDAPRHRRGGIRWVWATPEAGRVGARR